jgi:hypothetical protein
MATPDRLLDSDTMFAQAIWLAAICLEAFLVFRLWRARQFSAYPLFFSYLSFVLLQDVLRYLVAHYYAFAYPGVYWSTEFLGVFAGCGVVLEFYWDALAQLPGVAKLARFVLLLAFSLTFGKVLFTAMQGAHGWSVLLIVQLERDMRFVQTVAILCLLFLALRYLIPIGRNLRGIILGYGLFLGINIVNLTYLGRFGGDVQLVASWIQASAYFVALCVWTVFLWSYSPQPAVAGNPLDYDYSQIVDETQERLARTRSEVRGTLHTR